MDNAIPKEILNAKNTLMEEIKNLESRTCNILRVPNLIIEAVFKKNSKTNLFYLKKIKKKKKKKASRRNPLLFKPLIR